MHTGMQLDIPISAFQIRLRIVATPIQNTSQPNMDAVLSQQYHNEADCALALDARLLQRCQKAHLSTFMFMATYHAHTQLNNHSDPNQPTTQARA
jgi:hypothetical protein